MNLEQENMHGHESEEAVATANAQAETEQIEGNADVQENVQEAIENNAEDIDGPKGNVVDPNAVVEDGPAGEVNAIDNDEAAEGEEAIEADQEMVAEMDQQENVIQDDKPDGGEEQAKDPNAIAEADQVAKPKFREYPVGPFLRRSEFPDVLKAELVNNENLPYHSIKIDWNDESTANPALRQWLEDTYGPSIREFTYFAIL